MFYCNIVYIGIISKKKQSRIREKLLIVKLKNVSFGEIRRKKVRTYMEEAVQGKRRFAVLIDSDNISSKYAKIIFEEISEYGLATYRRIYGNWSKGNGWNEKILLENSIMPIQQFAYTIGKNSTDMAMVIDAMDIFYSGKVDGFCIVTSDSDFTRLAMRLREGNMFVIGMGDSKAPDALTKSCNKFVYLDILAKHSDEEPAAEHGQPEELAHKKIRAAVRTQTEVETAAPAALGKVKSGVTQLKTVEREIGNMISRSDNGKVGLAEVGNRLTGLFPDFDVRNYGFSKLSTLLEEKFTNLRVKQDGKEHVVMKNEFPTKEEVEQEIIKLLQEKEGCINNISLIQQTMKEKYPGFDIKDYGYSKTSGFVKSMPKIKVSGNTVTLKTIQNDLEQELVEIVTERGGRNVLLSQVSAEFIRRHPDFQVKRYGCKNFSTFLRSMNSFLVENDKVSLRLTGRYFV